MEVSPNACIPLFLARPFSENAVRKFMSILDGEDVGSDSNRHLVGTVSGAPTSVVVPLRGSLEDKYLQTVYTSSDDIDIAKKSQDIWYGVIDG